MKAQWPGLVHKSAQHAVHLDLRGDSQVRAAFRDLATRFDGLMTGVVLQPLAARGTELFAGVVQDEVFGPLVLFGLGGTATEVLADHAARLAPLTDRDVHELITSPRCAPLLLGANGSAPVDLEELEQAAPAVVPDGLRPPAARRGRLQPGSRGARRCQRARRAGASASAPPPGPLPAPTALRRKRP